MKQLIRILCSLLVLFNIALDTNHVFSMKYVDPQYVDIICERINRKMSHDQILRMLNSKNTNLYLLNQLMEKEAAYECSTKQHLLESYLLRSIIDTRIFITIRALENLIKLGAPLNFHYRSFKEKTPLILAAEKRPSFFVDLLLHSGVDATAQDNDGKTALIMAAKKCNLYAVISIVQELENAAYAQSLKPIDEIAIDQIKGELPPSYALQAATNDWKSCPLELLNCCIKPYLPSGTYNDINHQDHFGNTALMYAAVLNAPQIVQFLLDHGADATLKSNSGHTAYDFIKNAKIRSLLQQHMQ
jgi:hypothetical protein